MRSCKRLAVLVFSNVVSLVVGACIVYGYIHLVVVEKEKEKYVEFFEKDGKVFVAVIVPNNYLGDDEQRNIQCAKELLNCSQENTWKYAETKRSPLGYPCQIFVFEAVPKNERLALGE